MTTLLHTPPRTDTLERNLAALALTSPRAAEQIRNTAPRPDVRFHPTEDGLLSVTLGEGPGARQLASRRRPRDEAARFADAAPVESKAAFVVLGFGAGHHLGALAARIARTGVLFAFEPDLPLLRAVLERQDHSAWMGSTNFMLLTDADDTAAISSATRGVEGLLALGVEFLEHPPSLHRLAAQADRLRENFASAIKAVKKTVVTTLANSEVTIRNLLMNLDRYAQGPGVHDLAACAAGRPAVVVSAGPSLRRNVDLLARPGVRDRFVIIAAQTVLRPLLARGIRPHFVTALDYHEISRRFYEGLTPRDVEGVTLVVTPRANPAILESFPGTIRCVSDTTPEDVRHRVLGFLDDLLGPDLVREMGILPPGATVAHLAHSLARHLGCNPVILVGQDLGFTDGQYYAAGAAIHQVWSSELNPFNTLEMMEWQRIARSRFFTGGGRGPDGRELPRVCNLIRARDVLGRPIYTDEQMATYLAQFEREFMADAARGLSVIDATEGGVAKSHTTPMPLAEALEKFDPGSALRLPEAAGPDGSSGARFARVKDRVRAVRADVWKVAEHSRRTAGKLRQMLEHQVDQPRVNRLIAEVEQIRDDVTSLHPAFRLVDRLNQAGVLNRFREDRSIEMDASLSPMERQRRQIERDIRNVTWLADAADQLGSMLDDAGRCLDGAPKVTRDPAPVDDTPQPREQRARTVWAVVPVDPQRGGMGTRRGLDQPIWNGLNPLQMTLARLARCERLDGVVLLSEEPDAARALAGPPPPGLRLHVEPVPRGALAERRSSIAPARLWAPACWRAGLATATVYDEAANPAAAAPVLERLGIDAAVFVGADWCAVDPALVDAVIDRHLERPAQHRLTFVQGPPGLGACLMDRALVAEFAARAADAGVFATIGAALGYVPVQPLADPIARPSCVTVPPRVRDAQVRFVADSGPTRSALASAFRTLGDDALAAPGERIVEAMTSRPASSPRELILELCTGRRTSGPRGYWLRGSVEPLERAPISRALASRLLREHGAAREDAVVTFFGAGDPILHPDLPRLIAEARDAGIAGVHVRTDLACDEAGLQSLISSEPDVLSVDLMAETPATYRAVMGVDLFARVRANVESLLARARRAGGLPSSWIVPRLTRCDLVYEEIEPFFDRWIMAAGAAVIDALPEPIPGERIEPLPRPADAARRHWSDRLLVLCDGTAPGAERDLAGERPAGDAARDGLAGAWKKVLAHRQAAEREAGSAHQDLWTGW